MASLKWGVVCLAATAAVVVSFVLWHWPCDYGKNTGEIARCAHAPGLTPEEAVAMRNAAALIERIVPTIKTRKGAMLAAVFRRGSINGWDSNFMGVDVPSFSGKFVDQYQFIQHQAISLTRSFPDGRYVILDFFTYAGDVLPNEGLRYLVVGHGVQAKNTGFPQKMTLRFFPSGVLKELSCVHNNVLGRHLAWDEQGNLLTSSGEPDPQANEFSRWCEGYLKGM